MNRYHIFLIEDDVYHEYFYNTALLNRFFIAYMAEPNRPDLKKPFYFITCPIPYNEFEQTNQFIYLSDRMITIFSTEQLILDSQFIAQLEKIDRHAFIVDLTNDNYGWLTPKKSQLHWTSQVNVLNG
ncbi:sporulation inhibitor of replication protein SirA [Amphibacillus sp. MSJ-3]|uniref:sporulation inhibitor of replication protein SirA n=1 Tax=Amphibacillus sp. MSJ-3 TaxID=2841505 RepID=UPI001C0F342F|nr:sporulation inhibitor of replication protein SirA [Amphibacillus sp. MSJ-3]MBU5594188.1 sporulation inhibitor of replication protein SirA [Amphibacillus sp. MSJ-3]